jgi:hypothetical protein
VDTKTPRSDVESFLCPGIRDVYVVSAQFARELEIELKETKKNLQLAIDDGNKAKDSLNRAIYLLNLFAFSGPYEGRPSDDEVKNQARNLIEEIEG